MKIKIITLMAYALTLAPTAFADNCTCTVELAAIQNDQQKILATQQQIIAILAQHTTALNGMQNQTIKEIKNLLDGMEQQLTQQIQYPVRDMKADLTIFKAEVEQQLLRGSAKSTEAS